MQLPKWFVSLPIECSVTLSSEIYRQKTEQSPNKFEIMLIDDDVPIVESGNTLLVFDS